MRRMIREDARFFLVLALVAAGILGSAVTTGWFAAHGDSVNGLPAIERCVSDDFNDGSQDRCWSEGPQGVFVIDSSDHVVSTDNEPDVTMKQCGTNPDGPTIPDVCVTDDGDVVPDQD
jgi:hypothetical protein